MGGLTPSPMAAVEARGATGGDVYVVRLLRLCRRRGGYGGCTDRSRRLPANERGGGGRGSLIERPVLRGVVRTRGIDGIKRKIRSRDVRQVADEAGARRARPTSGLREGEDARQAHVLSAFRSEGESAGAACGEQKCEQANLNPKPT